MMRKILLLILLLSQFLFSQNISTGVQVLKDDLSVNIDIGEAITTLTITGPSNAWFAVGFDDGAFDMTSNSDVFRTDGTTITDAQTIGNQLPLEDESQDWELVSNNVLNNVRTIVATRANDTGDDKDFVFNNSVSSIDLIWAYGFNTNYGYHGGDNRGATTLDVTLSTKDFKRLDFEVYPNPILNDLTIQMPIDITKANIDFYDLSGRKIKSKEINIQNKTVNIEEFVSGIYLLKVSTFNQLGVTRILKK